MGDVLPNPFTKMIDLGSKVGTAAAAEAEAKKPKLPPVPDLSMEPIRNAKLMERRRLLGLAGRNATWLTGARGDTSQMPIGTKVLLGE